MELDIISIKLDQDPTFNLILKLWSTALFKKKGSAEKLL